MNEWMDQLMLEKLPVKREGRLSSPLLSIYSYIITGRMRAQRIGAAEVSDA